MATGKRLIYWDSCVFLAFLTAEKREEGALAGIRAVVADIERRKVTLITSGIIHTEIIDLPKKTEKQFTRLFDRSNIKCIDPTTRILKKAGALRSYYRKRKDKNNGKVLGSPDAIHLATAIIYKVNEFHTFDRKGRAGTLGLLPLTGNVAGHKLHVCRPESDEPMLDLDDY